MPFGCSLLITCALIFSHTDTSLYEGSHFIGNRDIEGCHAVTFLLVGFADTIISFFLKIHQGLLQYGR